MREEGMAAVKQKQPDATVAAAARKWQRVIDALKCRLRALQTMLVELDEEARRPQHYSGLPRAAAATPATAPPATGVPSSETLPQAARTAPPPAAAASAQGRAAGTPADAAGFEAAAERMAAAVQGQQQRNIATLAAAKAQRAEALSHAASTASGGRVDQPLSGGAVQARVNLAASSGNNPAAAAKQPAGPLQPSNNVRCCTASVRTRCRGVLRCGEAWPATDVGWASVMLFLERHGSRVSMSTCDGEQTVSSHTGPSGSVALCVAGMSWDPVLLALAPRASTRRDQTSRPQRQHGRHPSRRRHRTPASSSSAAAGATMTTLATRKSLVTSSKRCESHRRPCRSICVCGVQ